MTLLLPHLSPAIVLKDIIKNIIHRKWFLQGFYHKVQFLKIHRHSKILLEMFLKIEIEFWKNFLMTFCLVAKKKFQRLVRTHLNGAKTQ